MERSQGVAVPPTRKGLVRGIWSRKHTCSCQSLTSEKVGIPGRHFCEYVLPLSGTGWTWAHGFRAVLRIRASQSLIVYGSLVTVTSQLTDG
ncbi:hypothetical protein CPAR01_16418 [Colletotrichum paranaense]|uniref:Uncharacterized protein n=6 Tax=Colletotrichum acutatum species complex TaxID=2707335 RepID=A0A9Q0B207_9PEZI|nr:uncharacterized protein CCOS01_11842 [Colletotrichum costaricense]XP_060340576.1 uncharacterized protein CPAR01_16418 [Colletotrichum paranaense]XP_060386346.1 uncharacterized protein CTAM01_03311 [Colletotrichum tamarilloi]XP_060393182.1 uncharacterized protein CABS01_14532 [Colletotrichum abscissum]KAI3528580.1 hypothetical protein CSPX01_16146 [Colletotrichum filicis]KAK0369238.1 hypothetical protein CLIM01_13402 [Colletotrichum limetticola]KAK1456807.1 hypothetical protein CMEL01_16164